MNNIELEIRLGAHRQMLALLLAKMPAQVRREVEEMYAGADQAEAKGTDPTVAMQFRSEVDEVLVAARKLAR